MMIHSAWLGLPYVWYEWLPGPVVLWSPAAALYLCHVIREMVEHALRHVRGHVTLCAQSAPSTDPP